MVPTTSDITGRILIQNEGVRRERGFPRLKNSAADLPQFEVVTELSRSRSAMGSASPWPDVLLDQRPTPPSKFINHAVNIPTHFAAVSYV